MGKINFPIFMQNNLNVMLVLLYLLWKNKIPFLVKMSMKYKITIVGTSLFISVQMHILHWNTTTSFLPNLTFSSKKKMNSKMGLHSWKIEWWRRIIKEKWGKVEEVVEEVGSSIHITYQKSIMHWTKSLQEKEIATQIFK